MDPSHLVIGAECGVRIGTGHVMRCLALAQSWKRSGGSVTFLVPEGSPGIEQRISAEGFLLETWDQHQFAEAAVNCAQHLKPQVVVLDGYNFGVREQSTLSHAGIAVMAVDDYGHSPEYPVRWILNQNAGAREETYVRRGKDTSLLLGTAYALLRDEFSPWIGWGRSIPGKAKKLLVTIGGSDPDNLSMAILESIATLGDADLQVVVVAGSSNPHLQSLEEATRRLPLQIRIVQNALDIPSLMAWADIAISGAGGTSYELCYMGLPSMLFVIAENQSRVAEQLAKMSVAECAGRACDFDHTKFAKNLQLLIDSPDQRQAMSNRARGLVDCLGAERVRGALMGRELNLRPAREHDCQLLFSWANDPAVRTASFHSAPVSWEGHQKWFGLKLQDPHSVIYIGENRAGETVGQVRFYLEDGRATLSVLVAPRFRGTGWGRELVGFSIRTLARGHFIKYVDAFVKPDNRASIRLFEAAGFLRAGNARVSGQPALLFTWECGVGVHAI